MFDLTDQKEKFKERMLEDDFYDPLLDDKCES